MVLDNAEQQPLRLIDLLLFRERPCRLDESRGTQLRIVVSERHNQESGTRVAVSFLLQPAQANLQLGLGPQLRRNGVGHLTVMVDGLIVLLLILQRPADAVTGLVDPRTVAEAAE